MNYYPEAQAKLAIQSAQLIDRNPTVEENLDERIRYLESELQRLKDSKESLGSTSNNFHKRNARIKTCV